MEIRTELTHSLKFQHPIIQAPLAGGGDTPELVAAVCNAGCLGFIGAAYLAPEKIAQAAATVRVKTQRPFGINLFAPLPNANLPPNPERALQRLAPFFSELNLPPPALPESPHNSFSDQLSACLEIGASVFSFTFGVLPVDAMTAIKQRGMFVMGTATTVEEGVLLEKAGVDAVVAQGSEAGGHRGTFQTDFSSGMIGTMALVPQMVDAVSVPVIASGGIMDGRGVAAALTLGAAAVQMGTAFLTCEEAGVPDVYKQAILNAHEDKTRITRAFSGRPARGIANRLMTSIESDSDGEILPFPYQNAVTRPLRTAAAKQGRAEFLSLWAGQGVRLAKRLPAAELLARIVAETDQAIASVVHQQRFCGSTGS